MLKYLLNLFYPNVCSGCSYILLESENQICTTCRHEIPLTNHHILKENEAFKKFYGKIPTEFTSSMLYYHKKGITQQLIHNLKYNRQQKIGTVLGEWYAEDLKQNPTLNTVDYIIPVPLHKKRLKERGYNQITTFCKALSLNLSIAVDDNLLFRNQNTATQSKKNLINRSILPENTFEARFNQNHHNKHFLLIDDVLTTGATLENCGRAILQIPGAKISIVTIAFSES
ncbi:ComF family protein [Flavobacterium amniphilum]|uniref:ComF family protein n=1 Tax=Flavobacterium amniphilum TaxID=1834035 RepID=UPI002029E2E0|nr:ComF family protein [Flavobacterium amniphilum]MCL9806018.1 ComF family protein [Flavobacterium amniphilum]